MRHGGDWETGRLGDWETESRLIMTPRGTHYIQVPTRNGKASVRVQTREAYDLRLLMPQCGFLEAWSTE